MSFEYFLSFVISVKTVFGDSEEGRLRLYQTADVVLLLLNNGMKDASGMCTSSLHEPEGTQKEYRFAVFVASYSKTLFYISFIVFDMNTINYNTDITIKVRYKTLIFIMFTTRQWMVVFTRSRT